jgi:hypothetical protein
MNRRIRIWGTVFCFVAAISFFLYLNLGTAEFPVPLTYSGNPYSLDKEQFPLVMQGTHFYESLFMDNDFAIEIAPILEDNVGGTQLQMERNGKIYIADLKLGETVLVGDDEFEVASMTGWRGIKLDPQGVPYLSLAYFPVSVYGDESLPVVLRTDNAVKLDGKLFSFRWGDEPDPNTLVEAARWGIRDRDTTTWFSDLTPGTGMELDDGRQLVLFDVNLDASKIRVVSEFRGEKKAITVNANESNHTGGTTIHFSNPAQFWTLAFTTDTENELTGYVFDKGALVQTHAFHEDGSLQLSTGESIVFDSVLAKAVPITSTWLPWKQVTLLGSSERVTLRQGAVEQIGDTRVRLKTLEPTSIKEFIVFVSDGDRTAKKRLELDQWTLLLKGSIRDVWVMVTLDVGQLQAKIRIR